MYQKILKLNSHNNKKLLLSLGLQLLLAIVVVLSVDVLRGAINAMEYSESNLLYKMVLLGIGVTVGQVVLQYAADMTLVKTENAMEKTMQLSLLSTIFNLQKVGVDQYTSGDVITKLSQNTPRAVSGLMNVIRLLVEGGTIVVVSIVYMATLSLPLTLAMLVYNAFVRITTPWFNKQIKQLNARIVQQNNQSNSFIIQLITNTLMVRVFEREDYFVDVFEQKEKAICKDNLKAFSWSNGASEVIWATKKIAEVFILFGLGGWLVYRQQMDFGVIAAFTIVSDTLGKGLNALVGGMAIKASVIPEMEAIFQILEEPHIEQGVLTQEEFVGEEIRFENVSFSHGERCILENVSFVIPKGSRVLVTGRNGQGKSTVLKLIAGLYRPQEGRIMIGGVDTSDMHIESMRKHSIYMPQNPYLFEGTAHENISFPLEETNVCQELMEQFLLGKLDRQNPMSYSKGEKQRLCIARGLYHLKERHIVLGDEIFANVDQGNKQNISNILNSKCKKHTVLMVCHEKVDYKFDKQLIVEDGCARLEDLGKGVKG